MQAFLMLLCLASGLSVEAADSSQAVRQLRVETYPHLPPRVVGVLQSHRCTIPQPNQKGTARNIVRGEFFRKGQEGWAALCSTGGKSSILVFRDNYDTSPDEIADSMDTRFIIDTWDGKKLYSREISTVDEKFILRRYRTHGGPKPPPLDHDGIDDAFLEKASIVWYCHNGKWVQLQGAD